MAGKTGTAQWGPKNKERTAAWFAGFVPAEHPQYAFAALYESEVGSNVHGGTAAAPMIAMILKDVYKLDANGNRTSGNADRTGEEIEVRRRAPNAWKRMNRIRMRPLRRRFGRSSIVPLNFGSSRSTPKLSA